MVRISGTKANATGRSSGKVVGHKTANLKPPKGEPWVWKTRELLSSDAWRALSINTRRLLDFLEVEHMNHAGTENGKLKATYNQLQDWGLGAPYIHPAIIEAEAYGLLAVTFQGGRWADSNQPSEYRLTYLPDRLGNKPTNEWKRVTQEEIRAWKAKQRVIKKNKQTRRSKLKQTLHSCSTVPCNCEVPTPMNADINK